METKANYVLIGAFTLAVVAAAFGFVFWFQNLGAAAQRSPLRIVLGADATPEAARASLARALKRRGIASLQAAQPGRAHALWHLFYNSPFNVVALQVLAKWMYPDRFASLDPHATLHTMYQRFMPIALHGQYWVSL